MGEVTAAQHWATYDRECAKADAEGVERPSPPLTPRPTTTACDCFQSGDLAHAKDCPASATAARWEGFVAVCNTCDRKAQWPFCEHKTDDGKWFRTIRVREVGRGK